MKNIKLLLIIFSIVSCNERVNCLVNSTYIDEIAKFYDGNTDKLIKYVPDNITSILFVKLDNNKIFCTSSFELHDIYLKYYSNNSDVCNFQCFLSKNLNQLSTLDYKSVEKHQILIFKEDQKIMEMNVEQLRLRYLIVRNGSLFFYPKDLDYNIVYSVLYKLFLNGFVIHFDDYAGRYFIEKYSMK